MQFALVEFGGGGISDGAGLLAPSLDGTLHTFAVENNLNKCRLYVMDPVPVPPSMLLVTCSSLIPSSSAQLELVKMMKSPRMEHGALGVNDLELAAELVEDTG